MANTERKELRPLLLARRRRNETLGEVDGAEMAAYELASELGEQESSSVSWWISRGFSDTFVGAGLLEKMVGSSVPTSGCEAEGDTPGADWFNHRLTAPGDCGGRSLRGA